MTPPGSPSEPDWPELDPAMSPAIPMPRRPAWMIVVALLLALDGIRLLLFSGLAADAVLAPELGMAVGVAALAAAVGVLLAQAWGRLLTAGLATYWLAQTVGSGWAALVGPEPPPGSATTDPLVSLVVSAAINVAILLLVATRWPARR